MLVVLCLVPVAYLLGTFPTADLVARHYGIDVTKAGSGNPGASNVMRVVGWRAGVFVLLVDAAKGAVVASAGLALDGHRGAYILGSAAVIGHIFPVWRRFRGGRGVATAGGVFLVLFPIITVVLVVVWFSIARGLHKASVASLVCVVVVPVLVALSGGSALDIAFVSGVAVLLILRHASNLRRLVRGEEHGLGDHPDDRPDDAASAA